MIKNILILMSPNEIAFQYPNKISRLPMSLGLGILSGYLKQQGLDVSLKDMGAVLSGRFAEESQRIRFQVFYDYEKFIAYMENGENAEIDNIVEGILEGLNLDSFDSFGVSIGADFSFLQIHGGFIIAKYLKKKYGKPVFIGGNNISFLYIFRDVFEELWNTVTKQFEYIIKGAGEKAIWDIIKGINDNEEEFTLSNTCGLVRNIGGKLIANSEYRPEVIRPDWADIDLSYYYRYMNDDSESNEHYQKALSENLISFYKWPDTFLDSPGQLVSIFNRIKKEKIVPKLIIPYIFNYNCPFNCAFCTQSDYDRGSVIGGDVDTVFSDIIYLKEKYKTNYFYFLNNAFNYSAKFVDEFCRKIIDEKIRIYWSDCARFNNLTYERLKLMKLAGCTKLTFGFETGSHRIIELIDKKIDLEHAEQVLKWCHELGIWADIEVIIGLPQEFDEDFEATKNFIFKNKKYINYFWVNEYFVVPNSLIGRNPEKYGVELLREHSTYKELLKENMEYFKLSKPPSTENAKLYGFNEINGRSYDEILKVNSKKISILNSMQNKEFYEAAKFYKLMISKRKEML